MLDYSHTSNIYICFGAHSISFHYLFLQGWRKAAAVSKQNGYVFANENFLSVRTLTTLIGIKAQFLDYLAMIGFVPENCRVRNKRSNEDKILELTGPDVSSHCSQVALRVS
jgi:hypothetical protein